MIDIRKLKELVKLMVENDLAELDLRDKEETVTIRRGGSGPEMIAPTAYHVPIAAPAAASNGQADADASGGAEDGLIAIESPMVGTFYSAANPDSEAFVSAGSQVSEGTVVCIVEAMKVFNEIKSELTGTVERVCVKNGESVEFGQPLFMVRPS
ncbi:MAG: acetyl-CoA carboxylase biotin carboxyl carrier protein [Phycisphaeraceae bacterium]|nr:MAG: acetyl-CoA carboxylase biotin carboxyl carrier protein [Phycisphaeraceae bacterium]